LVVNSDSATASDLKGEFAAANIEEYAYTPPSTTTASTQWPTLNELISNGTRMISFVASLDPASNTVAPYLLDEFTFIFETPYQITAPTNFSCTPDRPTVVQGDIQGATGSGRLSFMNHFLYSVEAFGIEEPDSVNVTITNGPSGTGIGNLGDAAANCSSAWGKPPTFILVDFFDQGPAIETVDKLNGVTAVGRKTLPAVNGTSESPPNLFEGLANLTASVRQGKLPSLGNWISVGGDWAKALGTINI
jgi:hypothetical protein